MYGLCAEKKPKPGVDFFPLTVHYQEKTFAAGKIPGGYFKRETKPSEKEVLTSRLIDRPIRPLFANGFYNDTQVICTVLSHDLGKRSGYRRVGWRFGGTHHFGHSVHGADQRSPHCVQQRAVHA